MKNPLRLRTRSAVALLASLFLFPGLPISPGMQAAHVYKKVKVKDHKVKVKAFGGKAKLKEKAGGDRKLNAKGPNRGLAAAIARDAANRRDRAKAGWVGRRRD